MRLGPNLISPFTPARLEPNSIGRRPLTLATPAPNPVQKSQPKRGNTPKRGKPLVQKSRVRFIDVGVEKGIGNRVSSRGRIIRNKVKS